MNQAVSRVLTTPIRAPLRSLWLVLGLSVATWAGVRLAQSFSAPPCEDAFEGVLRIDGEPGASGAERGSLDLDDLERLRAAMPGIAVGGVVSLEVTDLAPPLVAVDQLRVVAADASWLALAELGVAVGRGFTESDARAAAPVCLIAPRLALALGGGTAPLGRHLRIDTTWLTVVGVLENRPRETASPDIVVPLEAGVMRVSPRGASALDQVLVGVPGGDAGHRVLAERVLVRSHHGAAGYRIAGGPSDKAGDEALLGSLRLAFVLLVISGLALAGSALDGLLRVERGR